MHMKSATDVDNQLAGKTTLLREVVRLLANDFGKRVVVVHTSDEIGGDGAVPHACLGKARRMSPSDRGKQHDVLLEAVQNHTPEVSDKLNALRVCYITSANSKPACGSRQVQALLC